MNRDHLKNVQPDDLVSESMDSLTCRFVGFTSDGYVELAALDTGRILPDLRRPEQVTAPHWRA